MKRILSFVLCILLIIGILTSCTAEREENDGTFKIACTSYPVAMWLGEITAHAYDMLQIIYLFDEGKDMHNYQPIAKDVAELLSCDMVVYIGGVSDKWIEDALKSHAEKEITSARLMNYINDIRCDENCLEDGHAHDHEGDEHIWLSVENAKICVEKLSEILVMLGGNSEIIKENTKNYIAELDSVGVEYKLAVETAKHKTLVFADRFPFVYLMEELGLEYLAAFPGCTSDTTASFETVIRLAKKVDELNLPAVIVIEGSDVKIADMVIENTKNRTANVVTLDSMQIFDSENGDYIETMRANLEALKIALGE